jgi:pectate lyase
MRKTLSTIVVATILTASAAAVSAQEQTMPHAGGTMQNEGAMQGGMMGGDMMNGAMMEMMAEMKSMMQACTEMMASMNENMDHDTMSSPNSDG